MLRHDEIERIAGIRNNLKRFEREGVDVSSWEATFFLKIIDRVMAQVEFKKVAGL